LGGYLVAGGANPAVIRQICLVVVIPRLGGMQMTDDKREQI
jgi:hypothetical protein